MSETGGVEGGGGDGGGGGFYWHSEYSEIFCWYFCSLLMLGAKSVELCYCVGMNGQTVCGYEVRGNVGGYCMINGYRLFHASNDRYFICLENPPLVAHYFKETILSLIQHQERL